MSAEQVEQAKRRIWSAYLRHTLSLDEVETLCRIIGRPTRLPAHGRPMWRRW